MSKITFEKEKLDDLVENWNERIWINLEATEPHAQDLRESLATSICLNELLLMLVNQ